ncbi:unnamed protein product, partial [Mesorhabditis belari]|uniref:RNA-polymerase II-associated protein 3-like C-terminal domain-containing protein n=1 Tax=Mesorhabditis belari TaxID=2138241 RepID=A0AAF3EQ65_9BILA
MVHLEEITDDNEEQKASRAFHHKEHGNICFGKKHYHGAIVEYTRSLNYKQDALVYGNRAQTNINLKRWQSALMDCNRALQLDPKFTKGLYRRALVLDALGLHESAVTDLDRLIKMAGDVAAKTLKEKIGMKKNAPNVTLKCVPRGDELRADDEDWITVDFDEVATLNTSDKINTTASTSASLERKTDETFEPPKIFADFDFAYSKLQHSPSAFAHYCLQIPRERVRFLLDCLFEARHLKLSLHGFLIIEREVSADDLASFFSRLSSINGVDLATMFLEDDEKGYLEELLQRLNLQEIAVNFGLSRSPMETTYGEAIDLKLWYLKLARGLKTVRVAGFRALDENNLQKYISSPIVGSQQIRIFQHDIDFHEIAG